MPVCVSPTVRFPSFMTDLTRSRLLLRGEVSLIWRWVSPVLLRWRALSDASARLSLQLRLRQLYPPVDSHIAGAEESVAHSRRRCKGVVGSEEAGNRRTVVVDCICQQVQRRAAVAWGLTERRSPGSGDSPGAGRSCLAGEHRSSAGRRCIAVLGSKTWSSGVARAGVVASGRKGRRLLRAENGENIASPDGLGRRREGREGREGGRASWSECLRWTSAADGDVRLKISLPGGVV